VAGRREDWFKKQVQHFGLSLFVCMLVFVPWQVYIMSRWPTEAAFEYVYNLRRLHEAVDSRYGTWTYYFQRFPLYYGSWLWWLVPLGVVFIAALRNYRTRLAGAIVLNYAAGLVFFSFVSKTMCDAYVMLVIPLGCIFIAVAVVELLALSRTLKYGYGPAALLLSFNILYLPEITNQHDPHNRNHNNFEDWTTKRNNEVIYRNLEKNIPPDVRVIMNAKDCVNIMFYNNDIDAYPWYLSEADFNKLKQMHARVGVFAQPLNPVPGYMRGYDNLYVIDADVR
jgi:hypothetical protein